MFTRPHTVSDPLEDKRQLKRAFYTVVGFALLLWQIKIIEILLGATLSQYGIFPGTTAGLAGILIAPLIHGSWSHLFTNTAPLLILGTALLYAYPRSAKSSSL